MNQVFLALPKFYWLLFEKLGAFYEKPNDIPQFPVELDMNGSISGFYS